MVVLLILGRRLEPIPAHVQVQEQVQVQVHALAIPLACSHALSAFP